MTLSSAQVDAMATLVLNYADTYHTNAMGQWEEVKVYLQSWLPSGLFQNNFSGSNAHPHDIAIGGLLGLGTTMIIAALMSYGLWPTDWVNAVNLELIGNIVSTNPYTRTGTSGEQLDWNSIHQ